MDHGAPRRLTDSIDIDLGEHHREGGPPVARRGDPFAHGRDEHAVEVGLGDRARSWRSDLRSDRKRTRQHLGPSLPLGHPLGRAERRETHGRAGRRREVAALDQRLQRSAEGARRERQPLRRDRGEQRRRTGRACREALEKVEAEECGRETGRARADHLPSDGRRKSDAALKVARDVP